MANFKMKGHTVLTQSGTDTPNWGTGAPTGAVLQVQSFTYTDDDRSGVGTTFTDTGLTVSITPNATTSKIMVMAQVSMGASTSYRFAIRLVRDSTNIFIAEPSGLTSCTLATASHQGSGGNMIDCTFPVMFLDSPSTTSTTTYKIQATTEGSGGTWYLNRGAYGSDNASVYVVASSITVMEIAG